MSVQVVLATLVWCAVLGVAVWLVRRRPAPPRYLVTLQKVTNANQQPETVTVQCNLPASATPVEIWEELEKIGMAAVSRMQTINEDILETNKRIADEIMQRKIDRLPVIRGELVEKRRRRIGRELGVPPEQVDALLAKYRADHLSDLAAQEEAS